MTDSFLYSLRELDFEIYIYIYACVCVCFWVCVCVCFWVCACVCARLCLSLFLSLCRHGCIFWVQHFVVLNGVSNKLVDFWWKTLFFFFHYHWTGKTYWVNKADSCPWVKPSIHIGLGERIRQFIKVLPIVGNWLRLHLELGSVLN
uniref:Uncharacterized protein n=1 Tax=Rhizophora mucronata TaxID=61149 RepID=A0A2P2JFZ8_RHIMU